jgi:ribose/xylose/arabinose/galactoside ABC-type transport system permease subunit
MSNSDVAAMSKDNTAPTAPERGGTDALPVLGRRRYAHITTHLRTMLPLLVAIVALSLYSNSRNSAFLTFNNYDNILSQISVLGILAAGQTFLVIGGQLDLSVGSFVSFIGVVAARMFANSVSTPIVVVCCLGLGVGTGLIWGVIVAYLRVPPFILTLGGLSVFSSLALVLSNNTPISVLHGLSTLGFGTWHGLRAPALTLLIVLLLTGLVLHFTRFGRDIFALGSSAEASFLAGLPVRRLTIEAFVLNGLLAGLGGLVMMARLGAGDPNSGTGLELATVAVTVLGGTALIGGKGTMLGTFLGALLFGTVTASLTFLQVAGAYQSLVSGGILIFAVIATAIADLRVNKVSKRPAILPTLLARYTSRPAPRPPAESA